MPFNAWEFAGKFPDILQDKVVGEAARGLYADATIMLKKLVAEKWLKARAVVGFFPANSNGEDDVHVFADETRQSVRASPAPLASAKGQACRIRRNYV